MGLPFFAPLFNKEIKINIYLPVLNSESGLKALDLIQIKFIEKYYDIVEIDIPIIEKIGGGSVRCMLLELF